MTTKEIEAELLDIFEYKMALTDKINHNTKEIQRIEVAIDTETNGERQLELKKLAAKGRKILKAQITERQKLSSTRVAKMLGLSGRGVVVRKFNNFMEHRR